MTGRQFAILTHTFYMYKIYVFFIYILKHQMTEQQIENRNHIFMF